MNRECYGWPSWHELGYWMALVLAACFITKRSWSWLWRRPCGCEKRQAWLNRFGGYLRTAAIEGWREGNRLGRWLYRVMVKH